MVLIPASKTKINFRERSVSPNPCTERQTLGLGGMRGTEVYLGS